MTALEKLVGLLQVAKLSYELYDRLRRGRHQPKSGDSD